MEKFKKSSYSQTHVLWVVTVLHWVNIDASSVWGPGKSTEIHGLRHSTNWKRKTAKHICPTYNFIIEFRNQLFFSRGKCRFCLEKLQKVIKCNLQKKKSQHKHFLTLKLNTRRNFIQNVGIKQKWFTKCSLMC